MQQLLSNTPLEGTFDAPPSKSVAHRLMIAATLAGGAPDAVRIAGEPSQDLRATAQCLQALTASDAPLLDCGESGSTLRFLLPIAAAMGKKATFIGQGRLPERPIGTLLDLFATHGVTASSDRLPLTLNGQLAAGEFQLPGNISSQFITGLLFALPLLREPSSLHLTTPLESSDYVRLTLDTLRQFGVAAKANDDLTEYRLEGKTPYTPPSPLPLTVEGDWSNAACFLAAGALGGSGITARGLNPNSTQGDRAIADLLRQFGAQVSFGEDTCTVRAQRLAALAEIDVRAIPDLVPVLAVVAGLAQGTTLFTHAARLRLKESDRLESTAQLLRALGGKAETTPETLRVTGVANYHGGIVDSCNDHRLVMAAALAATRATSPVAIQGPEAVRKSWPAFFEALAALRP